MTELFNPGIEPSFPGAETYDWPVEEMRAIKPYDTVVPLAIRPLRPVQFLYKALSLTQREYVIGFFHEMLGPAGDFYWRTLENIWSPRHAGPVLDEVTVGGAPGSSRTYYVRYSWYDSVSGQETLASPSSSKLVQSGNVLQVKMPYFPGGVKAARVYAHQTQGLECLQAFVTSRIWTEPVSGMLTGTSLPALSNNLKPLLKFRLTSGLQWNKRSANAWTLQFNAGIIEL